MLKRFTMKMSLAFVLALAGLAAAVPAAAQSSVGVRAGASVDPDQFYFGGHVETPNIADRLRFRPNIEIGVGDNITVTALNFEFAYHFESRSPWHLYAGAGPALNIISTPRATDPHGGFNLFVGAEHTSGLFFEVKGGAVDSPDLKLGVGYRLATWR